MEALKSYGLTLLTPPAGEPVSLAEAKRWLRVDDDDDSQDDEILDLIAAAREEAEDVTQRQLVSAKWRLTLDRFPVDCFKLPRPPLQAVTAISYYDTNEVQQSVTSSNYHVDTTRLVGFVQPDDGYAWPATDSRPDAVTVDFWAGYGPVTETTTGFEAGTRTITPTSMNGVYAGLEVRIGEGEESEPIVISSVTSTTFVATFRRGHPDPVGIYPALPRRIKQAIRMLVTAGYEGRGDLETPDAQRARETAIQLLLASGSGSYA